ncbi:MAG: tetratricopeptide repeat protein [Planctomycetota bacterium]
MPLVRALSVLAILVVAATSLRAQNDDEAAAALKDGRYREALALFERRLEGERKDYDDLIGAGTALYRLHESARAMTYFSMAQGVDRKRPEAFLYLGRIAHRRAAEKAEAGRVDGETDLHEALIHLGDAAARAEDPTVALTEVVDVAMALGAHERALEAARRILERDPENERARAAELAALYLSGRLEAFVERSAETGDGSVLIATRRVEALARMRRGADVRREFLALVTTETDRWEPWVAIGNAWSEGEAMKERLALFEAAREAIPDEEASIADFYLGYTYALAAYQSGTKDLYARAAEVFRRYLEGRPDDAIAMRHLAGAELELGRVDVAHEVIRRALELAPRDPVVREQAGYVVAARVAARDFERALSLHEVILAATPEDHALRRDQGSLLKELGRLEETEAIMVALIERDDVDRVTRSRYLNDLALCRAGLGRPEEELETLRRSLEVDADNLDARENLGVALIERGDAGEAAVQLARVVEAAEADGGEPRWRARYHLQRARAIAAGR